MRDIGELLEVEVVNYTIGKSVGTVRGVIKGWLHPTRITGILPGNLAPAFNNEHRLVRVSDGNLSGGQEFTLLQSLDGNVLVAGKPDELHKQIKEKLEELVK